jgi:hypothetical protein
VGLSRWVESWDALVSLERRRLSCIALLTLLAAGSTPSAARVVSSQLATAFPARAHTPLLAFSHLAVCVCGMYLCGMCIPLSFSRPPQLSPLSCAERVIRHKNRRNK